MLNEPNKWSNTGCSSHQKDNILSYCLTEKPFMAWLIWTADPCYKNKNHKNSIYFVGFLDFLV